MAQNNTIHNILEVVVGTADIRSSKKDLRHLRNLRDKKHSPLLRITNPQSLNRLGHFLMPDCKSGGTPNGITEL